MKKSKLWIRALATTFLAIPAIYILVLNPFENTTDFAMSDFYIRTANRTRPTTVCKDVVILAVDNLSRKEIALSAKKADSLGARTIALDIFMNWKTDDDNDVINSLSSCKNLILPSSLTDEMTSPVFQEIANVQYGYTNLECDWVGAKIRTFSTEKTNARSFAAVACGSNDIIDAIIRYDCKDFEIIYPEELCTDAVNGKIVLIGNINDFSDCHPTPIGVLPGVMIHAFIARTIIDNNIPRPISRSMICLIAVFIVYLFAFIHSFNNSIDGDYANFLSRIIQFLLLYFLYMSGAILFNRYNIYFDLSFIIILVAAMLWVYDIIFGGFSVPKAFRKIHLWKVTRSQSKTQNNNKNN